MRFKGTCSKCGEIVVCLATDQTDVAALEEMKEGELFEHKCPTCEEWAMFTIIKIYK